MKRLFQSMMLVTLSVPALTSCDDGGGGSGGAMPFRQDWINVIDQPFETFTEDGMGNITSITIGSSGSSSSNGNNFHNRGDVIVQFHDEDRILVEMRKFTMVDNQELADSDFDRLSIWASRATSLPAPPYELDDEDNCFDPSGETPWQTGCRVMVFYDGQNQVARAGADLRVTLPRDYIYELNVVTEDNDEDSDYQNRGNVCIEGLPGSADVTLGSGTATVILDDSIREIPTCPDNFLDTCEEVGWDEDSCPCIAQGFTFGQVRITSRDGTAADTVVDIPSRDNFWVGYNMRNDGDRDPGNDTPGASCEATVDPSAGDVILEDRIDLVQAPNENAGSINFPGDTATQGAGYRIDVTSNQCQAVLATEAPADFVGIGDGPLQNSEERGNLNICSGCARTSSCNDLIPGL